MQTDYTESIIKAENLTYAYKPAEGEKPKIVLDGVNLEIEKGTFVAVLGHNGSGKTTLAKHFNAILLPMGGHVYVSGMDTLDESLLLKIRETIGMVFQNPDNQIVANVVEEDVAFAPENLGCPPAEIRRRVDEALQTVGMYEYREHAPHLLSGGQKQRIAIAGVLAMNPACIVFDEPTAMLDPKGRESVVEIIRALRATGKVTVVLITHHMEETIDADRLIVMSDGHIIMDGTPRAVFKEVEKLRQTGLDVPETVSLLYELNTCGFNLRLDALSVEECTQEIYRAFT
jgi:energy-coupling factor transport system ATP-binding protein